MIESNKYKLNAQQYLQAYETMLLLRRFEEKCGQLYGMGLIGGFCHLYIGQEAVITAVDMAKSLQDSTITSYRSHAHSIVAGTDPKFVLAELCGKRDGSSKGKGGSMHLFNIERKFYGGHGIVGAQVSLGTGVAFAAKYQESDSICFTFLGDGAVHQGQVFEAWNMAALWKLPIIYIIENNEYAMGTSIGRSTVVTELYKKGASVNIPGYQVDGMDVEVVFNAISQAIDLIKAGHGPLIIEAKTYRYRGHSMSDPALYRSKEEVNSFKERDPLINAKYKILKQSYASEEELQKLESKVKTRIQEITKFAEESPFPADEELYTEVYVDERCV